MADGDWIAAGDYYNPNPIGAGGILSSSGHGWFAPSGTGITADNPNAIVPGYAPDNYTQLGGGAGSNQALVSALRGLSQGAQSQSKSPGVAPVNPGTIPVGQPRNATNLSTLLQILGQHREALLNSATGGVGAGASQARPSATQGLLGF